MKGLSCPFSHFQAGCGNKEYHWSMKTQRVSEVAARFFWCQLPISSHQLVLLGHNACFHLSPHHISVLWCETKQHVYTVFSDTESASKTTGSGGTWWINFSGHAVAYSHAVSSVKCHSWCWRSLQFSEFKKNHLPKSRKKFESPVLRFSLTSLHMYYIAYTHNSLSNWFI